MDPLPPRPAQLSTTCRVPAQRTRPCAHSQRRRTASGSPREERTGATRTSAVRGCRPCVTGEGPALLRAGGALRPRASGSAFVSAPAGRAAMAAGRGRGGDLEFNGRGAPARWGGAGGGRVARGVGRGAVPRRRLQGISAEGVSPRLRCPGGRRRRASASTEGHGARGSPQPTAPGLHLHHVSMGFCSLGRSPSAVSSKSGSGQIWAPVGCLWPRRRDGANAARATERSNSRTCPSGTVTHRSVRSSTAVSAPSPGPTAPPTSVRPAHSPRLIASWLRDRSHRLVEPRPWSRAYVPAPPSRRPSAAGMVQPGPSTLRTSSRPIELRGWVSRELPTTNSIVSGVKRATVPSAPHPASRIGSACVASGQGRVTRTRSPAATPLACAEARKGSPAPNARARQRSHLPGERVFFDMGRVSSIRGRSRVVNRASVEPGVSARSSVTAPAHPSERRTDAGAVRLPGD